MGEVSRLGKELAMAMGKLLGQHYEIRNGEWWLFNASTPVRPLSKEEVIWHVARRHKPFVEDGVDVDDPRWWDEPSVNERGS